MSPFVTRQATIQDLDQLVQLFDQYRIFYEQESDKEAVTEFIWNRFEHSESIFFLTIHRETGEAAGFTQLYPSFSSVSMQRIWVLNDLFVDEKFRGNQVGGLYAGRSEGICHSYKGNANRAGHGTYECDRSRAV